MYNIISKHNSQILKAFQDGETAENKPFSNCKTRANCPAGDTSDSENVLYQATIFPKESINDKKNIGMSTGNWKERRIITDIPSVMLHQNYLSKQFWKMKDAAFTQLIKWEIICRSFETNNFRDRYDLCIREINEKIKCPNTKQLLNERNEMIFKCRHGNKFKIP